jgi:WD40 repeat protein
VLSSERLLRPRAVVYHPSSHALWIAQAANLLVLPDDARFERKFTWQNPYGVENEGESLALDVTENIAAVGDENGQVHVFHSRLPTESGPLAPVWTKVLNDRIEMRSVAISPDERYIVVGDRMGNLFRIDARSQALRQHVGHRHFITGLRFVTDEIFASSSRDGTVRFWRWQLDAPEELFHLSLGGPVLDISFSRDRRLLAVQVEGQAGTHFWHLDALWQRFASLDVPLAAPPAWNQGR